MAYLNRMDEKYVTPQSKEWIKNKLHGKVIFFPCHQVIFENIKIKSSLVYGNPFLTSFKPALTEYVYKCKSKLFKACKLNYMYRKNREK